MQSNYLTEKQAADFLNIKPETLRTWRFKRKGPSYHKDGYFIRYSISDLKAYMDGNKIILTNGSDRIFIDCK